MNLFLVSNFLISLTSLVLILILAFYGKAKIHRIWAFCNVAIFCWGIGTILFSWTGQIDIAAIGWKIGFTGGIFIATFYYHTVYILISDKINENKNFLIASYIFAILSASLTLIKGNLVMPSFRLMFGSIYYPIASLIYSIIFLGWGLIACVSTYKLYRFIKLSKGSESVKAKYLLFAFSIGFIGGGSTHLPSWGILVYPFGNFGVAFYAIIGTYAILKHRLMDIEVVIKKTLVFAGLFTSVFIIAGLVTFVLQNLLGKFIPISNWLYLGINIAILILLYDPIKKSLINITNKYLFQKKYDPLQLLKTFSDMVLASVLDQAAIIKIAVDLLIKALSLENFEILLMNKEGDKYQIAGASGIEDKDISFSNNSRLVTYLSKTFSPVNKRNYDKTISNDLVQDMKTIKAELCIPLVFHKTLIGFLAFGKRKSGNDYTNEDVNILVPLTRDIAIAIVYARLYEEVRQKDKLATLGTLVAGIKHEIGNPLSSILTSTQLIIKEMETWDSLGVPQKEREGKFKNTLEEVLYESRRIGRITKKFTDFAKPGDEGIKEIVNIEDSINSALEILQNELNLRHIKIEKNIPKDTPSISADKDQIHQIFFNILRNAAQAIEESNKPKEEARISIVVRKETEDRVAIDISDTGCGISEEKKTKIFEPFYTTKQKGKGTGLGLAIVRQLAGRNKGDISFKSQEGEGTTFTLEFPIAKNG